MEDTTRPGKGHTTREQSVILSPVLQTTGEGAKRLAKYKYFGNAVRKNIWLA